MPDLLWSGSMQMARCCNHRCHKQGRTGSQHLSLSLLPPTLLFLSHTLSVAQNDLPLRTRVCSTGRPLASIYQHWAHPEYCPSFWRGANQTNKRTNGERGGGKNKGRKGEQRGKTVGLLLPTSSIRWTDALGVKVKASSKTKKKDARESSLMSGSSRDRPLTPSLGSACISKPQAFISEQPLPPPPVLIICLPSIYLSLPCPLLPQPKPPFFKLVPSLLSHTPLSPLGLRYLPPAPNTFHMYTLTHLR